MKSKWIPILAVLILAVSMPFALPVSTVRATSETFDASDTWTAPAEVTSVTVYAWGGGGAGGGTPNILNTFAGGGGGGGAISWSTITVTPGRVYNINIGAAGAANSGAAGGSGGTTSFVDSVTTTTLVSANGGTGGGIGSTSSGGSGGGGGTTGGVGTNKFVGGNGGNGRSQPTSRGGGGGGSAGDNGVGGNGGNGGSSGGTAGAAGSGTVYAGAAGAAGAGAANTDGPSATNTPGAAGGGAGGTTSATARTGGAGTAGRIILVYTLPPRTITSSAGANGSISPLGATSVVYGGSQAYTITPSGGYIVGDVLVDGVSVGYVTSYTFTNVTADHTISATFVTTPSPPASTTGTVTCTSSGGRYICTFTGNGGFTPSSSLSCDLLVVAGGGGGGGVSSSGNQEGGGGGAGGFVAQTSALTAQLYSVTVGAGGSAGTSSARGGNGGNSSFGAVATATGGGGGGSGYNNTTGSDGNNGGSGGGGARYSTGTGYGSGSAGPGISGQGNNGVDGASGRGGGGGGAGAAGSNQNGGNGTASSISGTSVPYAGGGGGGEFDSTASIGGTGGGGAGSSAGGAGTAGTANTGGGGGGASSGSGTSYNGGAGGSGIVIVSCGYKATPTIAFGAAPTPTYLGGNFTVSATTTNADSSALTYSVVSGPCAWVSGATFSSSGAGTCVVQASGAETTHYYAASQTQNVTIAKATPTATLAVTNSRVCYDGSPHAATVSISTSSVPGSLSNILTGGAANQTVANTYAVTADFVPNDSTNYNTLTGVGAGNFVISNGLTFNSTTSGNWSVPGTWDQGTVPLTCDSVVVPDTKTLTVDGDKTIAGSVTVNGGGTLNMGTYTLSGAGSFTLSSGGTLGIGSQQGITAGASGNIQTTGRSFSTGANYTYNGTAAQVTGNALPATVNDLTANNTAGVTLSGAVNVQGNLTIGSGATLDVSASSYGLNVAGNWTNNGGMFTTGSGTVTFNGAGAQTLGGTATNQTFNNFTVNKSAGTLSVGGSTTTLNINGTVTLTDGIFNGGTDTNIFVKGNWINNSNDQVYAGPPTFYGFASGTSTVTFNGSGTLLSAASPASPLACQQLGAGIYFNLTIAAGTCADLTVNTWVINNLVVQAGGTLNIKTFNLWVDGSVTNNGAISQVKNSVPTGGFTQFLHITNLVGNTVKYEGVDIQPATSDMGVTTVTVYGNQKCTYPPPAFGGTMINRCYVISPANANQGATVNFWFVDGGILDEKNSLALANIRIYRNELPTNQMWKLQAKLAAAGPANGFSYVQVTTVASAYGTFGGGQADPPNLIELASFSAAPTASGIRVAWETASEIDDAGFNVWRSEAEDGEYQKINPELIPAQGGPTLPASYSLPDPDVVNGRTYFYKLEDIDIYAVSTLHGPVSAKAGQWRPRPPQGREP